MNGRNFGRDQRDYVRFRESDSADEPTDGSFTGHKLNRFGEERPSHDHYQDDQYRNDYDPTYEDEYGMKHPYEHSGASNRWSDDIRSEAARENHSGKGPKGYTRSRDRIIEEACERLSNDYGLDASDIEVDYENDYLVLKGEVHSRHDKRLAEDIVEDIAGVNDVLNQLQIKKKVEGWVQGLGHVAHPHSGGKHEQG
jgi:hypothetical protein